MKFEICSYGSPIYSFKDLLWFRRTVLYNISIEFRLLKKIFYFFGTYTHKVVALFINPELLLHDYFRMYGGLS